MRRLTVVFLSVGVLAGCGRSEPLPAAETTVAAPTTATNPATTAVAPDAAEEGASVAERLDAARARWADAGVADYRLTVGEQENIWSAGCTWSSEIAGGVVIDTSVDQSPTSGVVCPPLAFTVESLHEEIAGMLADVEQFAADEFGEHVLEVEFDDLGVPTSIDFDLANGADEETLRTSSITVRTSPVVTAPPADAIEEALIVGTLAFGDGCLYLDGDDGRREAIVFRHGTTWDAENQAVVNDDGTSIAVGQRLSASGGGHDVGGLEGIVEGDAAARVESCAEAASTRSIVVIGYLSPG